MLTLKMPRILDLEASIVLRTLRSLTTWHQHGDVVPVETFVAVVVVVRAVLAPWLACFVCVLPLLVVVVVVAVALDSLEF